MGAPLRASAMMMVASIFVSCFVVLLRGIVALFDVGYEGFVKSVRAIFKEDWLVLVKLHPIRHSVGVKGDGLRFLFIVENEETIFAVLFTEGEGHSVLDEGVEFVGEVVVAHRFLFLVSALYIAKCVPKPT